jgi:hypothetical protein
MSCCAKMNTPSEDTAVAPPPKAATKRYGATVRLTGEYVLQSNASATKQPLVTLATLGLCQPPDAGWVDASPPTRLAWSIPWLRPSGCEQPLTSPAPESSRQTCPSETSEALPSPEQQIKASETDACVPLADPEQELEVSS